MFRFKLSTKLPYILMSFELSYIMYIGLHVYFTQTKKGVLLNPRITLACLMGCLLLDEQNIGPQMCK